VLPLSASPSLIFSQTVLHSGKRYKKVCFWNCNADFSAQEC
jgi:hypothetical protein